MDVEKKKVRTEDEKIQLAKKFLENRGWIVVRSKKAADQSSTKFAPLESVTKPSLTTDEAAFYLNLKPQTLRAWSCNGGPIMPIKIGRRNAWRTSDIRSILDCN